MGLILFFVVQQLSTKSSFRLKCVQVLASSVLIVAVLGIVQYASHWGLNEFWLKAEPDHIRISSTLPDPNSCGILLGCGLFLLPALRSKFKRLLPSRIALALMVAVTLAALLATRSHASMAAVFLSLPVYILLRINNTRKRLKELQKLKKTPGIIAASVFIVLISLLLISGYNNGAPKPGSAAFSWLNQDNLMQNVLRGRMNIWRSGLLMVAHKPATGLGPGSYYQMLHYYKTPDAPVWNPDSENSHNQFLQFAAELGIPGLAFYCALICGILWRGLINAAYSEPDKLNLNCGLFCAMLCFLLASMTGHPLVLFDVSAWFWILAGLTAVALPQGVPSNE